MILYVMIVLLGTLLSLLSPWWWAAALAGLLLCGWKAVSARQAFWISGLAVLSIWLGYAVFLQFTASVNLSDKVANIFSSGIPALSALPGVGLVNLFVALISFLLGALSGLSGIQLRRLILGR